MSFYGADVFSLRSRPTIQSSNCSCSCDPFSTRRTPSESPRSPLPFGTTFVVVGLRCGETSPFSPLFRPLPVTFCFASPPRRVNTTPRSSCEPSTTSQHLRDFPHCSKRCCRGQVDPTVSLLPNGCGFETRANFFIFLTRHAGYVFI